ncbi:MAG: S41 family peptidase [Myxococcales bacterium]
MRVALAAALFVSLPAIAAQHIAVLELKNKLPPKAREQFPADYLTDQIREAALHAVDPSRLQIISRENLLVLLKSSGKSLEECEGECEVDTGRRIGADYIISGELLQFGSSVKCSLRLHDTSAGTLLSAVTPGGHTPDELEKSIADSMAKLLAPLKTAATEAAAAKPRFFVEKASGPSTLADLGDLTRAIKLVKDGYYDPGRVDPQRMLDGAISALASSSGGAVEVDATSVRAGGQAVSRPRAGDLATVVPALQEVGRFLNAALPPGHALLRGAAGEYVEGQGMLQALDAHSTVLTPSQTREMKVATRGDFGGLGIVVNVQAGKLRVVRVMPATPAERAGLRGGDVVVSIDGKPMEGVELADAVNLLRGPIGSTVHLVIDRAGTKQPVDIERATVKIDPIRTARLPGDVGYLRLESFITTAAGKVKDAFAAVGPVKGLVLDLRSNPGGLLQQGVEIADFFLPSGSIVVTTGAKVKNESAAKPGEAGESVPLAVLVDGVSGAATEIVAGALRFNGRAILIGKKTAGRGTVQSLYDLADGASVRLTVAQYLVAGVHSVEGLGIAPDVERDTKFEEDPAKDPIVGFARQVLAGAASADRDALLAAAQRAK